MKDLEEEVEQVNKAMEYLKEQVCFYPIAHFPVIQDAEASKIVPYSDRIAEFTKNIVIKEEVVESYQPVVDVSITPEANVVECLYHSLDLNFILSCCKYPENAYHYPYKTGTYF